MTQRKIDNPVYEFLSGTISGLLSLEYAIRASHLQSQEGMKYLKFVDERIREYWTGCGANEEEIRHEALMDFGWDALQLRFSMVRGHGKLYAPSLMNLIKKGQKEIPQLYPLERDIRVEVPATNYYRICDLLAGNDIDKVLKKLGQAVKTVTDAESEIEKRVANTNGKVDVGKITDDVFSRISAARYVLPIRQPSYLHPGIVFGYKDNHLVMTLDTTEDFTEKELVRQIREFIYLYALMKEWDPTHQATPISGDLIGSYLLSDIRADRGEFQIDRINSFGSALTGLSCWDKCHLHGFKLADAIKKTVAKYPEGLMQVGPNAIRKSYGVTEDRIQKLREKFADCAARVLERRRKADQS